MAVFAQIRRGRGRSAARLAGAALAVAAALLALPSAAGASVAHEEAEGARVLREIKRGDLACGAVTPSQFDHVGEYAMGRALGSPARHEAMNEAMTRTMGAAGETRVHVAMGQRYSGCGGPALPGRFAWMMGATGRMDGAGYGRGTMMGGGYGPGMMDGGHGFEHDGDGGVSAGWIAAGAVIALAAIGGAFLAGRRLGGAR